MQQSLYWKSWKPRVTWSILAALMPSVKSKITELANVVSCVGWFSVSLVVSLATS